MSQTGADSLAKQGYGCEDIIKHFYIGVEVVSMCDLLGVVLEWQNLLKGKINDE